MLKRLLLTVLMACLVLPMAATRLDAATGGAKPFGAETMDVATPCHGHSDQPGTAPATPAEKHQCIGCAPLVEAVAMTQTTTALVGLAAIGTSPRHLTGTGQPPATPPPKA